MMNRMAIQQAELARLIDELGSLTPEERKTVLSAVADAGRSTEPRPGLTPKEFRELMGFFRIGGNAVEDCDRLYDA